MPNKTRKKGGVRVKSRKPRETHRSSVHNRQRNSIITSSFRQLYGKYMENQAEPSPTALRAAARSQKKSIAQGAMNAASAAAPTVSFAKRSRRWHKGPTRHVLPHYESMTNARSKRILAEAKEKQKKAEARAKREAQAAHAASANQLTNMFGSMKVKNEYNEKNEKNNE